MQTKTINLNGKQFDVDQFTHAVQHLVIIHNQFLQDLQKSQLETMKNQAAIKMVIDQLTEQVEKELLAKTETVIN